MDPACDLKSFVRVYARRCNPVAYIMQKDMQMATLVPWWRANPLPVFLKASCKPNGLSQSHHPIWNTPLPAVYLPMFFNWVCTGRHDQPSYVAPMRRGQCTLVAGRLQQELLTLL